MLLVKSVESVVAVFQQNFPFWSWAAESIERSGTIRLPFAHGRTSPVAASDVAEVVAEILRHPSVYAGRAIELTGPSATDLNGLAEQYAAALAAIDAVCCDQDEGAAGRPDAAPGVAIAGASASLPEATANPSYLEDAKHAPQPR